MFEHHYRQSFSTGWARRGERPSHLLQVELLILDYAWLTANIEWYKVAVTGLQDTQVPYSRLQHFSGPTEACLLSNQQEPRTVWA